MDEYSVSQCREAYPEPGHRRHTKDGVLFDIEMGIAQLKAAINNTGKLTPAEQERVSSAIKDLEHMTRGRWVA